jgi:hypothetical protein
MELDDFALEQASMLRRLMPDPRTVRMMQEQANIAQKLLPTLRATQQVTLEGDSIKNVLSQANMLQRIAHQAKLTQRLLPEISVLQKLVEQTNLISKVLPDINTIPVQMARNTDALLWAYESLSKLHWANIGTTLNINREIKTILGNNFYAFSNSYLALSQSFGKENLGAHLASSISAFALPEVELFNDVDLLERITVQTVEHEAEREFVEAKQSLRDEISTQTMESLESLLFELDVDLIPLWQGAYQALTSSNVDRSRHFLISLRELFTQVIHQLSPDDQIKHWTTSPEHFDDKGRPTRKARLLFICRYINYDPFNTFVEKDIASILSAWDIFNRAHQVAIPFTQEQLVALKIRVECALRLLLTTGKLGK